MKRSTDRILTTHVGSLIRPGAVARLPARQGGGGALRPGGLCELPEGVRRRGGAPAGRDRPRRHQRRRVRQGDQLVAIRAVPPRRFRAAAVQAGRRQPVHARRRPHAFRGVLRRPRFPRQGRDRDGFGRGRPDHLYGTGRAAARYRQFQSGARQGEGDGRLPAGRRARERHSRPQERILQDRRRPAAGDRRRHAHRIQDDHRLRPAGAARRRARRRRLRPHGAAEELQGVSHLARQAGRDHQLRDQGPAARPHPLSRLLGKLAGTARERRGVRRHRRPGAQGEGRRLFDRGCEPASRA